MSVKYFILVCVFICIAVSFEHSNVVLEMKINGQRMGIEGFKKETVQYITLGDTLEFSCGLQMKYNLGTAYFNVVHEQHGLTVMIPGPNMSTQNFIYTTTGDDIYNESQVYCIVKVRRKSDEKLLQDRSNSIILIITPDGPSNESISEVYYNEDKPSSKVCGEPVEYLWPLFYTRKIVDGSQYNVSGIEELPSKPADDGVIVYCDIIDLKHPVVNYNMELRSSNIQIFTREICNKTKYVYNQNLPLSSSTQKVIIVGVVIFGCITLVAGIIRFLSKRNRPSDVSPSLNQDTANIYACPNQVVYAQLQLSEGTDASSSQKRNETPYAQIVGFLGKK